MPIEIRNSGAPLGHEIQGVDLTQPLAASTFAEIEQAFNDCGVVVIRDQKLTPTQHLAFSHRFGETERYPVGNFTLSGHDEILVVSNIIENGQPIGLIDAGRNWHSDMLFTEKPPRCSLLYSLEVPHQDGKAIGDTLFASTAAAYDDLPADLKNGLTGLKARHSFSTYAGTKIDGREKEGAAFLVANDSNNSHWRKIWSSGAKCSRAPLSRTPNSTFPYVAFAAAPHQFESHPRPTAVLPAR